MMEWGRDQPQPNFAIRNARPVNPADTSTFDFQVRGQLMTHDSRCLTRRYLTRPSILCEGWCAMPMLFCPLGLSSHLYSRGSNSQLSTQPSRYFRDSTSGSVGVWASADTLCFPSEAL
jgi:hypothetical protein